mgnify:CR=1 FL=1
MIMFLIGLLHQLFGQDPQSVPGHVTEGTPRGMGFCRNPGCIPLLLRRFQDARDEVGFPEDHAKVELLVVEAQHLVVLENQVHDYQEDLFHHPEPLLG